MTNLLILLTLTPELNNQYRDRLKAKFPELRCRSCGSPFQGRPLYRVRRHTADLRADAERRRAARRHQAQMGAGARHRRRQSDRPAGAAQRRHRHQHPRHSRRAGVGSRHRLDAGAGPRYAARAARPGRARNGRASRRKLLHNKTVGIFGIGAIAEELAPKCKAFGMRVVGVSSAPRAGRRLRPHGFERRACRASPANSISSCC